jgi:hypothetical protein
VKHDVGLEQVLLDLENEILLTESGGAVDLETFGHLLELGDGFSLQLCDVHADEDRVFRREVRAGK